MEDVTGMEDEMSEQETRRDCEREATK
jgi:hypothetical protein